MKLAETKDKIRAIELLQIVKKKKKYRDLSAETGIQIPLLNRYALGKVLPNLQKARKIIELYGNEDKVRENVVLRIKESANMNEISTDIRTLKEVVETLELTADIVVVREGDGVPFATLIASFCNADLIIVPTDGEVPVINSKKSVILADFFIEDSKKIQELAERIPNAKIICLINQGTEGNILRNFKPFIKLPEDMESARLTRFI